MILSPLLLAKLSERPELTDSIIFQFNGLLIVFTALGSIWLLMEAIGFVFKQRDARLAKAAQAAAAASAAAAAAQIAPAPAGEASATDGISAATVAVVSAAVHVVLAGRRHRVLSVKPSAHDNIWAAEGRREIFGSHKVR